MIVENNIENEEGIYTYPGKRTFLFEIKKRKVKTTCFAYRYRYRSKFYTWLPVFLEKAQTTGTNQNFIIRCRYFSSCYLFVSLWHCSHMSVSYLSSDDGLIFFWFSFCGALGLLLCLKSKSTRGVAYNMGNYHKSYLHAYLCQNFWANGEKFGLEDSLKMMLWEIHRYQ